MPSKTEEYLALAQRTANGLTRYWESWTDYLTTASRLYKYPFADQLMIYAQRPDATACADFDIWNNRMNRYVRRGAKGIALLDESGGYPRLHYVFDVSDTAPRRNALYPDLWQINESLKEPVRSMLAENYGVHSESFGQQLADVAGKLVQSYRDNNSSDILGIVDGSYFLPNLTLNQPRKPLGKYGRLRRTYLMNHRPVLYSTMLKCMDNGIAFTSMADGECLSFMRTRHVYALFSNALDNAVEAVMRVSNPEKRVISLHVRRLSGAVEIAVMNYYEGEIRFKNDLPQTIKTDGRRHGFGTSSMQYIVSQYGGTMKISAKDSVYLLEIRLNIPEKAEKTKTH